MSNITACIFDLDGVIVETSHFHYLAWKRLADELDIPFDEKSNELLKGVSRVDSLKIILQLGNRTLTDQEFNDFMVRKNTWYLEYLEYMRPSDALSMVVPFLDSLRSEGIKISLASSSKNAKSIIDKLELNDRFDAIKDGNDVVHAKPNPDIFLQAAKALNSEPENCVVFEDAIAGVEAAIAANMKCVGVGEAEVLGRANYVIRNFKELDFHRFKTLFS